MSALENIMALHIRAAKLPEPEREVRFHPQRRWRFDFAWPARRVALEVEGGTWGKSRHTTGSGFRDDCEKYAAAVLLGWRVLRVTSDHVKSGEALQWVEAAMKLDTPGFEAICTFTDARETPPPRPPREAKTTTPKPPKEKALAPCTD